MNITDYIGIPYKNRGRAFDGIDCYGIIVLFYKQEFGITLSDYTEFNIQDYEQNWYKNNENHISNNWQKEWKAVENMQQYDSLLFSLFSNNMVNHCGIYLGDDKFLHIHENRTSCIERLTTFWQNRLKGICRNKQLAEKRQ